MTKKETIEFISQKLKGYGAEIYNYRGTEFIGIKNPYSDNNMAFTFSDEEFAMEFTFQTARFEYGKHEDATIHAEKYLTDKLCAVEIFLNGKPVFGGSRESSISTFKTAEEFATLYAGGNEAIEKNILTFASNGNVTVCIFSWSGKYDRKVEIIVEGETLKINELAT